MTVPRIHPELQLLALLPVILLIGIAAARLRNARSARIPEGRAPIVLPDWRSYAASQDSSLTSIVVFSDFKCAGCRYAHDVLTSLPASYRRAVAIKWWQFPILGPVSIEAARAVACVSSRKDEAALTATLFSAADSLGIVPWADLAARSGIVDGAKLQACVERDDSIAGLLEAKEIALRLGIASTPTVVLDSLVFRGMPSRTYLHKYLERKNAHNSRPRQEETAPR